MTEGVRNGGILQSFKEVQSFNKALLEKQVWRILTNPNLLVSKVLKAKYFNNESILKCKVPKQSSWMWQSLMDSRDLVQEGTRRKVRNGRSINIWNDGWIPGNKDGRVQTDKPPNCDVSKVEDLIRGFR